MAFASSFTGTALGKAAALEPYKRDGVYRTLLVKRLPAACRSNSCSLAASKAPPCGDPSAHHTRSSWARIRGTKFLLIGLWACDNFFGLISVAGVILASAASWTGTSGLSHRLGAEKRSSVVR
ncbi:hypothetical protein ASPNIDRAFT_37999 [Aspergillus niger ATCC 1015]|uniref:Uncharacterized protein n=1 Tax=Aspergillus niger (strain ATCC 1015 / CBS 113.46 / FGSC A1144 / LSHB Ac4 / NCTC 3858a / NRRL 328 / USDA 3528.7) TaxID=380704 RepID=G3YF58_ASPNA|nr:hypothetical protein ASPNIDRAFT_37999 [Aspergillus niger ATCC 1015]